MSSAANSPETFRLPERRSFLTRAVTLVMGLLVFIFPFAAGLGVLFHPLRRKKAQAAGGGADEAQFIRICSLDTLRTDGMPQLFPVITDVVDAWARTPGQRIGSVYLARTDVDGKPDIRCFTTTCPHLGCAVDFIAAASQYECPCHVSAFAKDGQRLFGPALRGLDPLQVKLDEKDGQTDVLVAYERFRTGIAERIPIG